MPQGDYKKGSRKRLKRAFQRTTPSTQLVLLERKGASKRRRQSKIPREPLPKSYVCQLLYSQSVTCNPSTDANGHTKIDFHIFRANNIFDPNYTGNDHQPRGRDDLAAHYNKYVVLSSYIEARPVLNTETHVKGYSGVELTKKVTDSNHPLFLANRQISIRDVLESSMKYNKVLRLTRDNSHGASPNTTSSFCMFNGTKVFGKGWTKDTDFQMQMNEAEDTQEMNPDQKKNYYFYLWQINDPASGTHSVTTHWIVNIKFIVKFFDRKAFSAS